jgi:hypothetical protein
VLPVVFADGTRWLARARRLSAGASVARGLSSIPVPPNRLVTGSLSVTKDYVNWWMQELRRREAAESTARRLSSDFLVFVSYSWADEVLARDVTGVLDRRGIRYVQDRKDVEWGDRISEWVEEEIKRSSDYLLILTKASAASAWCTFEFGVAVGSETRILTFVADPKLDIPPFAAGYTAARELRDVESFFAKARIDDHEVERLLEEILGVKLEKLAGFVPRASGEAAAWDAPDREERETRQESARGIVGGVDADGPPQLLGLEFPAEGERLVLEAKKHGYRPGRYELAYAPELTAVVVTLAKAGSSIVGVREDEDDGPRLRPGGLDPENQLKGRSVHGWPASLDFWVRALQRLREALPAAA